MHHAPDASLPGTSGSPGSWSRARVYAFPLLLLLCVTLPHLDAGDWQRSDGAWYGAISLQAWRTGEFVTLYAEPGAPYFNKPPLAFWISGLFLHVLGPGPVAARLPTILAAAVCVVLTVSTARIVMSGRGAMWAGIVLALTYEFFRRTREISLDMWQAVFLIASLRLVVGAIASRDSRRAAVSVALSGVPVGLALMCKPLVGLAAIPILAVAAACAGRWRLLPWFLASLALAISVAAPWHLAMHHLHGDAFTNQYFGREIAERAAGSDVVNSSAVGRWWFYLEKLALHYWPWLVPLVGLAIMTIRRRVDAVNPQALLACAVWVCGWLALLSIFPDRRDRYGLVFYPALAVLPAAWLLRRESRPLQRFLLAFERHAPWVAPSAAIVLAVLPVSVQEKPDPQWPALLAYLRENGGPDVWQGGIISHRGARLYLDTGRWPIPFRDAQGNTIKAPPPGSLLLYHEHDAPAPGPEETVVFRSGYLVLTRTR